MNAPTAKAVSSRAIARRSAAIAGAVLLVLVAAAAGRGRASRERRAGLPDRDVDRGPIDVVVTATGTVNPVTTVQVGTYVSGPILAIYVDFNSPVTKGQLVAKIDPRPFQVKVLQAEAKLANAKAQGREVARRSRAEAARLRAQPEAARAQPDRAERSRHRAQRLRPGDARSSRSTRPACSRRRRSSPRRASTSATPNITSPVDGVVVSRSVDVGQTVAASFQTPKLFQIAQDLTKMQVNANVSESDIGGVHDGQPAQLHRRRVSRAHLRGQRRAGAQRADHGAERRDLRRRDRGRESGPRAQARHDRDGLDHDGAPRRRACACRCARCASSPEDAEAGAAAGVPPNSPVGSAVVRASARTARSSASRCRRACATSATPSCSTGDVAPGDARWSSRSRARTTRRRRPPRRPSCRSARR